MKYEQSLSLNFHPCGRKVRLWVQYLFHQFKVVLYQNNFSQVTSIITWWSYTFRTVVYTCHIIISLLCCWVLSQIINVYLQCKNILIALLVDILVSFSNKIVTDISCETLYQHDQVISSMIILIKACSATGWG